MTLQEALNSGRPFKRSVHGFWMFPGQFTTYSLTKGDLLAMDWETKEKTTSVTADQLRAAGKKVMGLVASSSQHKLLEDFIAELVVELGL